jgi:hypothetical protein
MGYLVEGIYSVCEKDSNVGQIVESCDLNA